MLICLIFDSLNLQYTSTNVEGCPFIVTRAFLTAERSSLYAPGESRLRPNVSKGVSILGIFDVSPAPNLVSNGPLFLGA